MISGEAVRRILSARDLEVKVLEPQPAEYSEPKSALHPRLREKLGSSKIDRLYTHQAQAYDAAAGGSDVMVVTGTSSGKSLCYNLPVLDSCLREPMARALYLFPTKALAQDQAGKLAELMPEGIYCGTYDGDSSPASKAAVRKSAHIVLTNPDMLHLGILPNQESWHRFFKALRFIVIDEAHSYRGVFGSHVAWILQRLLRLCAWQGNRPQIIACSATIANAGELFQDLTSRTPTLVDRDTGPKSTRTITLVHPPEDSDNYSSLGDVSALLAEFAQNHVRTLTFCRSRNLTEILAMMTRSELERMGGEPKWVDSYRGGYTAKERRQIEQALFKGSLRGLTTTNAMELGIDVGGLDAVILTGFPGSISSFWQQVGRAGRGIKDGLSIMFARTDPLEQYLVKHPELLFDRPVERATLNPSNPYILGPQLLCAAYERPVSVEEIAEFGEVAQEVADELVGSGQAVWQSGRLYYPSYTNPAKGVNIRGTGGKDVLLTVNGQPLGDMEYWRALREAHVDAVYLHRGVSHVVLDLDLVRMVASLVAEEVDYSTVADTQYLVEKTMTIRKEGDVDFCAVKVTSSVLGYRKLANGSRELIGEYELDFPPIVTDTVGARIDLPDVTFEEPGTVHAIEHALLIVAPLLAGCDRNDLGSCRFIMSPDTMMPVVYLFDHAPGGVGLSEALFEKQTIWFNQALSLLESCPCTEGCPSCLYLPNGNNSQLDKQGAVVWLRDHI